MRAWTLPLLFLLASCAALPPATPAVQRLLDVKRLLDSRFTYISDQKKWGEEFHWEQGMTGDTDFTGDCEEYADAALYQLHKRGIKGEEWLVKTETGEFHMVTCAEGWCIDNRRSRLFEQSEKPYRWVVSAGQ